MGVEALAQVLRPLTATFATMGADVNTDALLVGLGTPDDAAVYRLNAEQAIVATTDFFPPVVDDAYTFGAIAAANALSDIYAMGGTPLFALNLVGFPDDLDPAILSEILRGGAEKVREAGALIAGGHTVTDAEPKYGLAAIGIVHPERIFTKGGARPGDALILTKPIGTGVLTTALKQGVPADQFPDFTAQFESAVASMTTLNAAAVRALRSLGDGAVHACTDITGFSLLGHAWEMASQSGVSLRFALPRIPWLPGARDYAAAGYTPGGTDRNAHAITPNVTFAANVSDVDKLLLFDPQTSGGLFVAVAGADVARTLGALAAEGVVGHIVAHAEAPRGDAPRLYVDAIEVAPDEHPQADATNARANVDDAAQASGLTNARANARRRALSQHAPATPAAPSTTTHQASRAATGKTQRNVSASTKAPPVAKIEAPHEQP